MKSIHQEMSFVEFENQPWRLGWKHEYYDGKMHLTPSPTAVVYFRLGLKPRPQAPDGTVRPIRPGDVEALIALYREAFVDAPEFADWDEEEYARRTAENVRAFVDDSAEPWRHVSCLLEEAGQALAAAFIVDEGRGPVLQPVFVKPTLHRRSLASKVMDAVVNGLHAAGVTTLLSYCHLANAVSDAWHRRYGFEEIPDEWSAAHRARYFAHELDRRDRLGQWTGGEREEWRTLADYWMLEWTRLRALKQRQSGDERVSIQQIDI